MKRYIASCLLTAAAALLPPSASAAFEVRGIAFPDRMEVDRQPLHLNGAGVRVKFIVDVYAASLYLPQPGRTPEAALGQPGPKSVHAVMLRDVSASDFVDAMIEGFKANNSEADVARFMPYLQSLSTAMSTVGTARKGTDIRIDYLPGTGTRILVDGKRQGADIPGEDFYQCLLRIWLGPHPVDRSLKASLLGAR